MKNLILLLILIVLTARSNASEAVGSYNSGKLQEADNILEQAPSALKLLRPRKRWYATSELAGLIESIAVEMRAEYPESEPLQIGDVAALNGGKIAGHKSHQNGLDADIVYYSVDQKIQDPEQSRWEVDFVHKGKLSSNFHSERNWTLFNKLIETKQVSRIFVDKVIKKHYCLKRNELYKSQDKQIVDEVLRRLRPEPLHSTHLHLRIVCPKKDTRCQKQPEPAKGSGCNEVMVNKKPRPNRTPPFNDRPRGGNR